MTDPGESAQPTHPAPPVPPYSAPQDAGQFASPPLPQDGAPPQAPAPHYSAPAQYPTAPAYPPAPQYATAPAYPPAPQYAAPQAPYAGYAQPAQAYGPYVPQPQPAPPTAAARGVGIVAFVLALIAATVAPIVGAVALYNVGAGISASSLSSLERADSSFDWSLLTPVREWVLLSEIAFWAGTVLGIWALVQGIVAIARKRGRGWGVAAVVIATIGAVVFSAALTVSGFAGLATSAASFS